MSLCLTVETLFPLLCQSGFPMMWVSLFKFSVDTLPPQRQTLGPAAAYMAHK